MTLIVRVFSRGAPPPAGSMSPSSRPRGRLWSPLSEIVIAVSVVPFCSVLASFPCARTPLQAELQTQHCTDASRAACRRGGARVSQHAHHLSTGLGVGRWPAATGPFAPATVTAPRHDPSRVSREPADRPFTQKEKEMTAKNMRGEKQGARGTWRRARKELTTEKGKGKGGAENCAGGKSGDRVGEPFTVYRSRDAAHEHASASFPL